MQRVQIHSFIDPFWEYTRAASYGPYHHVRGRYQMCGGWSDCLRSWPRPPGRDIMRTWRLFARLAFNHHTKQPGSARELRLLDLIYVCLYFECWMLLVCSLDLPSNSEQCSGVLVFSVWGCFESLGFPLQWLAPGSMFKCLQWGKWYTLHSLRVVFASFVSILSCFHCTYRYMQSLWSGAAER